MRSDGFIKTFDAGAAITKKRIVMVGAADNEAITATAGAVAIGVSAEVDVLSGDTVDVIMSGTPDVEYGGAVTRGARLASDATGRAVAAATADECIGVALESGVAGDIRPMLIAHATNHA